MASSRLTAYLRAIKALTDDQYGRVRSAVADALWLTADGTPEIDRVTTSKRRQTIVRLVLLSCAVCGIELCYAAETAFVSPIILRLGVPATYATLSWCLSPLLGLVLGPLLGSLSDRCPSPLGRRRPFILLLSGGIVVGLLLVPRGASLGVTLGDHPPSASCPQSSLAGFRAIHDRLATTMTTTVTKDSAESNRQPSVTSCCEKSGSVIPLRMTNASAEAAATGKISAVQNIREEAGRTYGNRRRGKFRKQYRKLRRRRTTKAPTLTYAAGLSEGEDAADAAQKSSCLPTYGIALTIIGVVLLDCCCDACQSPCRTYLLDVSQPEDHAAGLATFTVMAGLGGSVGYLLGGVVDWQTTGLGSSLGGHVQVVFGVVLVVYIVLVTLTVSAVREVPLERLQDFVNEDGAYKFTNDHSHASSRWVESASERTVELYQDYGTQSEERFEGYDIRRRPLSTSASDHQMAPQELVLSTQISLFVYLRSVIRMPRSLIVLCLTNLFCWASLVCYSLYFTDFVGQSVYHGDPTADAGSVSHGRYEAGVRAGAVGMALYSASCSVYSLNIEKLVHKFGACRVYVVSQLVYTVGAIAMALLRHRIAVVLLSVCPGVMYATLFTMPYLLVAHYHSTNMFADEEEQRQQIRGLGTDIAVVSSMVFVAQFVVSAFMGAVIDVAGSPVVVMIAASILSLCGAVTASKVTYLGL